MSLVVAVSSSGDSHLWSDLLSVVLYGVGAGVGLTLLFSVAIRGLVTGAGHRRDGNAAAAFGWSALGFVSVVACLAAVVLGVLTMLHR